MIRKFLAPVPGQRFIQFTRQLPCLLDERGYDMRNYDISRSVAEITRRMTALNQESNRPLRPRKRRQHAIEQTSAKGPKRMTAHAALPRPLFLGRESSIS